MILIFVTVLAAALASVAVARERPVGAIRTSDGYTYHLVATELRLDQEEQLTIIRTKPDGFPDPTYNDGLPYSIKISRYTYGSENRRYFARAFIAKSEFEFFIVGDVSFGRRMRREELFALAITTHTDGIPYFVSKTTRQPLIALQRVPMQNKNYVTNTTASYDSTTDTLTINYIAEFFIRRPDVVLARKEQHIVLSKGSVLAPPAAKSAKSMKCPEQFNLPNG